MMYAVWCASRRVCLRLRCIRLWRSTKSEPVILPVVSSRKKGRPKFVMIGEESGGEKTRGVMVRLL